MTGTGTINKTGAGLLQLSGLSSFSGGLNINEGGLFVGITNGGVLNSTVTLASGTIIDLNGLNGIIGGLAGSGTITNSHVAGTAGTLFVGYNNENTVFSGSFSKPRLDFPAMVNVVKMGTGVLNLTGVSNSQGTLVINNGTVLYSGNATSDFVTQTVNATGVLTLDNSGTNVNNRLGGIASPANATLVLGGGSFNVTGNATATTTEAVGALTLAVGGSKITLTPTAAQSLTLNVGALSPLTVTAGASLLLRGTNLGGVVGTANTANLVAVTTVPTQLGGAGAVGTTTMSIRPDILVDTSATGNGTSFATYIGAGGVANVTGGNGFRALAANEYASFLNSANTANDLLGMGTYGGVFAINTTINSLTLTGNAGTRAAGALALVDTLTITSGGILVQSGNSVMNGGLIAAPGTSLFLWTPGASTSLTLNASVTGTGGITKDGAGALTLGARQLFTGTTNLNGGSMVLNGGANTLFVSGLGVGNALNVNNGRLDLNGNNQLVAALASSNTAMAYAGGTITNLSGTTATLTATGTGTFAGVIEGNLNFTRSSNTTTTLLSNNTYTGATIIRGGILNLQQYGQLSATSSVSNYFGTLNLDSTNAPAVDINRLNVAADITLQGGTLAFLGFNGGTSTQNVGDVTILSGASVINATRSTVNTSSNAVLTLASLTVSDVNTTTVNFTSGGTLGQTSVGNSQIIITNAPTLTNSLIGGWAVVNGTDFASYLTPDSAQGGVGALGSVGYAAYSSTALTAGTATDNITLGASVAGVTTRTVNSIRVSAASTMQMNTLADTLTIASGGLLFNGTASVLAGGRLTAGTAPNTPATLYAYTNATATLFSPITDNGTGAVSLVKSGTSTLTLTPANSMAATTTAASNVVTVPSTTGLVVGQPITGNASIPTGATITSITGPTTFTISTSTGVTAGTSLRTDFNPVPIAATTTTYGSPVISVASTNGLTVGMAVSGVGAPVALAGIATTSGSSNVTFTANAGLYVGMAVTGPGIPLGATVASITNTTTFVLSTNATQTITGGAFTANAVIPAGAVITAINGNNITLSAVTTGAATNGTALTFGIANQALTVAGLTYNGGSVQALKGLSGGVTTVTSAMTVTTLTRGTNGMLTVISSNLTSDLGTNEKFIPGAA
ncbi:MAG: hypothetical protein B7Z47_02925, partial [Chthoniobacter sp. 12-60-6]